MKAYTVRYEQDEAGYWVATVLGIPGCHTQGRSIATVRVRVPEALAVCVDDASDATLHEVFRLKAKPTLALARKAMAARTRAEKAEDQARKLLRAAVRELLHDMSHRDAAAVLGISHQRIAQLAPQKRRA